MTNLNLENLKQNLGEKTQNLESKAQELWNQFSPHYTNLEPYQRGLILIGLIALIALAIYYLTHENSTKKKSRQTQAEAELEARLLKRMETLKRLRE